MTGPEVKEEIDKIRERQAALIAEHHRLQHQAIYYHDQCPHDKRVPYAACGVETAVCVYCGDEKHVRDYNLHVDYR